MVICKNCRFYESSSSYNCDACHHNSNIEVDTVTGEKSFGTTCRTKNCHGDCVDFEQIVYETVEKKYLWWTKKRDMAKNAVRQKL